MNVYKPCTLNDNWFEERASALRGVLADYGDRCYGTSHCETFRAKQKTNQRSRAACRAQLTSAHANVFTAVTPAPEIALAVACQEAYQISGCNSAQGNATTGKERYQSTYASDFGSCAGRVQYPDHPATFRSGQQVERGIATSGMIGEVFKNEADPQKNTAAQRAWLPTSTLIIDPAARRHVK